MLKTKKVEVIKQLSKRLENANAIIICDYKGLKVSELEELRILANAKDTKVQIIKNSLASIALKNSNMTGIELKDTNLLVWSDDVISASKVTMDFASKYDKFIIKAGYLDKEVAQTSKIEAFSKLPSRDELLGMLAATWMAPIANFTIGLDALRQKKEEVA